MVALALIVVHSIYIRQLAQALAAPLHYGHAQA